VTHASLCCWLERLNAGISPATSNHYLVAIKGFTKWLVKDGRAHHDPLAKLSAQNVEIDVRKRRRILSQADFARFLDSARNGKPFRGLLGADREILYTFAARSGLRAHELVTLTPKGFTEEADGLYVTVQAAYSKHRETDVLPVHPDLTEAIKDYIEDKPADEPIWPGAWYLAAAEMVRLDLDQAGIPYEINGEQFDFHALRAQFITAVLRVSQTEAHARQLSRHKSPSMLDKYNKMHISEARNLMSKVASISRVKPFREIATA
jgi:integrase